MLILPTFGMQGIRCKPDLRWRVPGGPKAVVTVTIIFTEGKMELVGLIKKPAEAPGHSPDDAEPPLVSSAKTGTPHPRSFSSEIPATVLAQPHRAMGLGHVP